MEKMYKMTYESSNGSLISYREKCGKNGVEVPFDEGLLGSTFFKRRSEPIKCDGELHIFPAVTKLGGLLSKSVEIVLRCGGVSDINTLVESLGRTNSYTYGRLVKGEKNYAMSVNSGNNGTFIKYSASVRVAQNRNRQNRFEIEALNEAVSITSEYVTKELKPVTYQVYVDSHVLMCATMSDAANVVKCLGPYYKDVRSERVDEFQLYLAEVEREVNPSVTHEEDLQSVLSELKSEVKRLEGLLKKGPNL